MALSTKGYSQRLRALSMGSKRQFAEDGEEEAPSTMLAIRAPAPVMEEDSYDHDAEDTADEVDAPTRGIPAAGAPMGTGVKSKGNEDDLREKCLRIQKEFLDYKESKALDDARYGEEILKLKQQCHDKDVEMDMLRKDKAKLQSDYHDALGELKVKKARSSQLEEELLKTGNVSKLRMELSDAYDRIFSLGKKNEELVLSLKMTQNEQTQKSHEADVKSKRESELLHNLKEARLKVDQKDKQISMLENEIEIMNANQWNMDRSRESDNAHTAPPAISTPPPASDAKAAAIRQRLEGLVESQKREITDLQDQVKAFRETSGAYRGKYAELEASLKDAKRMSNVTEVVLKMKMAKLKKDKEDMAKDKEGKEASLKRSLDGLVQTLEERDAKFEMLEAEMKESREVLEEVDKLAPLVQLKSTLDAPRTSASHMQMLPYARKVLPHAVGTGNGTSAKGNAGMLALKRKSVKSSRRKTIIPVLSDITELATLEQAGPSHEQTDEIFEIIQQIPFMKSMNSKLKREFATKARVSNCAGGSMLMTEGEKGSEAYILIEGLLEVFTTVEGVEQTLKIVKPGSIIGEMALLREGLGRQASVRAVTDAKLFVLLKQSLDSLLEVYPQYREGLEYLAEERMKENLKLLDETRKLPQIQGPEQLDMKSAILAAIVIEPHSPVRQASTGALPIGAAPAGSDVADAPVRESENQKRLKIIKCCLAALAKMKDMPSTSKASQGSEGVTHNAELEAELEDVKQDLEEAYAALKERDSEMKSRDTEMARRVYGMIEKRTEEVEAKDAQIDQLVARVHELEESARKAAEDAKRAEEESLFSRKEVSTDQLRLLKKRYDDAAEKERELIQRTESLWSEIHMKHDIEITRQEEKDNRLKAQLREAKRGVKEFLHHGIFVPNAQAGQHKSPLRANNGGDQHQANLELIDEYMGMI